MAEEARLGKRLSALRSGRGLVGLHMSARRLIFSRALRSSTRLEGLRTDTSLCLALAGLSCALFE